MDIYEILRVANCTDKKELQAQYIRLLESYRLVANFAESPDVAQIAQAKIVQLQNAAREAGLVEDYCEQMKRNSTIQDITSIKLALNSSRSNASLLRGINIMDKIESLPNCAEKHYLKTVTLLKLDTSFSGCKEALKEIQEAVKLDPGNIAYNSLMDALEEQFAEYQRYQTVLAEQAEKDRIERERQSALALQEAERRRAQALQEAENRRFWDSAGPCLSGLSAIAMYIIGCICCCNVCCGDC